MLKKMTLIFIFLASSFFTTSAQATNISLWQNDLMYSEGDLISYENTIYIAARTVYPNTPPVESDNSWFWIKVNNTIENDVIKIGNMQYNNFYNFSEIYGNAPAYFDKNLYQNFDTLKTIASSNGVFKVTLNGTATMWEGRTLTELILNIKNNSTNNVKEAKNQIRTSMTTTTRTPYSVSNFINVSAGDTITISTIAHFSIGYPTAYDLAATAVTLKGYHEVMFLPNAENIEFILE